MTKMQISLLISSENVLKQKCSVSSELAELDVSAVHIWIPTKICTWSDPQAASVT